MVTKLTSDDRIVGARLRLRRKHTATSTEKLAEILGISLEEIAEFEAGEARIGPVRLAKASRALGAPIAYFFAPLGPVNAPAPAPPSAEPLLAMPGAVELLSAYSRIANSPLQAAVLRLVQRLAHETRERVSPRLAKTPSRVRRATSQAQ